VNGVTWGARGQHYRFVFLSDKSLRVGSGTLLHPIHPIGLSAAICHQFAQARDADLHSLTRT
jgi:hypothetical protein